MPTIIFGPFRGSGRHRNADRLSACYEPRTAMSGRRRLRTSAASVSPILLVPVNIGLPLIIEAPVNIGLPVISGGS